MPSQILTSSRRKISDAAKKAKAITNSKAEP
jgi:hypothetical protein